MEILLSCILIVLVIILMNRVSGLNNELVSLRKQLAELLRHRSQADKPEQASRATRHVIFPSPPTRAPLEPPVPPLAEVPPVWASDIPEPQEEPVRIAVEPLVPEPAFAEMHQPKPRAVPPPAPPRPPRPSFFERHPDLEKFIGENLINKIGITVLVIGIGLLLQYAIGQGLISETGRTLIGLAAGGLLVFFAHRSRAGFRAFSSVLVAGGITVFYFTIAIAFHQYHLIGQTAAFAIMVVITALAVALTLAYDRKELAVISLLGGFATPFLVSSGDGNFRVLFTYLLILNIGMLVLANFKKWHIINIISFALTVLLFGLWAGGAYPDLEPRPSIVAFAFATAFFLVFFIMNLRYNLRHKEAFTALDHTLLLVNTAAYYAVGLYLLSDLSTKLTGLFTVLLGLFYLGFALYFHRRQGIPEPLKLLLIGLVLTFVSLAAPVQLEGSYITLFWAAEAVLLLWFSQRTGLRLVERASVLIMLLMFFSLAMDLSYTYGDFLSEPLRPLLNKGWITGMVAVASLGATTWLLRRSDLDRELIPTLTLRLWQGFTLVAGIGLLYLVNFLELRYQLGRVFNYHVTELAEMVFTLAFVLVLDRMTRKLAIPFRIAVGVIMVLCGLIYITGFHLSSVDALWQLQHADDGAGYAWFHYIAFALMVAVTVRVAMLARVLIRGIDRAWTIYLWAMAIFLVIFASQELDLLMQASSPDLNLSAARRVGYPILWGIGSFLFMWYGMRQRLRTIRVIALCLFGLTLVKLFLFDIGALSQGGRVAAFIILGALLLLISFMYQKLKVLLQDDAPKSPDEDVPVP